VSEEEHWICKNHGAFQGYYYFHYLGIDRNVREKHRDNPYFEACAEFCEKYDQAAFDPDYDTLPLSFFEPMLRRVMARPRNDMALKAMEATGAKYSVPASGALRKRSAQSGAGAARSMVISAVISRAGCGSERWPGKRQPATRPGGLA